MRRVLIIFTLLLMSVFFVSGARTLPNTVNSESLQQAINSTGTYCFQQSIIRDEKIKIYIDEQINDVGENIKSQLRLFKFINSIVTFIAVFLAFYLNQYLKFKREKKLNDINNKKMGFDLIKK